MFFFFTLKTAYELRISDWSSDVCSSDLALIGLLELALETAAAGVDLQAQVGQLVADPLAQRQGRQFGCFAEGAQINVDLTGDFLRNFVERLKHQHQRSEEHTSELQSLMRISYAVFCLNKKTKQQ